METITIILPALVWKRSKDHLGSNETMLFDEVIKYHYDYAHHMEEEDRWCGAIVNKGEQEEWFVQECSDNDYDDICKAAVNAHYLKVVSEILELSAIEISNQKVKVHNWQPENLPQCTFELTGEKVNGCDIIQLDPSKSIAIANLGNSGKNREKFQFIVQIAPEAETE